MVFSSLIFLVFFLPITVLVYYITPRRVKNLVLLIASLIFYAWGEPSYIFLMLFTTLYIWLVGLLIDRFKSQNKLVAAKVMLVVGLVISLGILAYYKYDSFIVSNIPFLKNTVLDQANIALPIGISFYTFQALSYVIDVYRGNVKVQKNWLDFTMYVSFFPQLIAGPIVKYSDVEAQIENRETTLDGFVAGIYRFCIGLGKKVLIANQIGALWNTVSSSESLTVVSAWLGAFAFAFQIYFDFSAYSDMAIGLGKMFGFEFPENFRYPYESKSVSEFWRRWHITLSTWFREYVYIPLGGNRKGKCRLILNLFIVWSLTGLWHGAAWQFVLWGVYYFIFLTIEKLFLSKGLSKCPLIIQHIYTILVVLFGWVLFSGENLSAAVDMYKAMFGVGVSFSNDANLFLLGSNAILFIICIIGSTELPKKLYIKLKEKANSSVINVISAVATIALLWICVAFLMGDGYNPFLYFRF